LLLLPCVPGCQVCQDFGPQHEYAKRNLLFRSIGQALNPLPNDAPLRARCGHCSFVISEVHPVRVVRGEQLNVERHCICLCAYRPFAVPTQKHPAARPKGTKTHGRTQIASQYPLVEFRQSSGYSRSPLRRNLHFVLNCMTNFPVEAGFSPHQGNHSNRVVFPVQQRGRQAIDTKMFWKRFNAQCSSPIVCGITSWLSALIEP